MGNDEEANEAEELKWSQLVLGGSLSGAAMRIETAAAELGAQLKIADANPPTRNEEN